MILLLASLSASSSLSKGPSKIGSMDWFESLTGKQRNIDDIRERYVDSHINICKINNNANYYVFIDVADAATITLCDMLY